MNRSRALTVGRWALAAVFIAGMALGFLGSLLAVGWVSWTPVFVAAALGYGLVGLLVTGHRPGNPVGWVFLGAGACFGLNFSTFVVSVWVIPGGGEPQRSSALFALTGVVSFLLFLLLCTMFTLLLYPDGLPSRRWRPVLWLGTAGAVAMVVASTLGSPVQIPALSKSIDVANPVFGDHLVRVQSWIGQVGAGLVFACSIAALASAVMRTWRATGVHRLQMRWFAASVILVLVVPIASGVLTRRWSDDDRFAAEFLAIAATLPLVPVACGVAILRYRLYEIDRIISRTLSYALVTGTLLALYVVVVTTVTQLLPGTSSSFSVAAATLAAAALFRPLLTRVRAFIDRRFNRARFDAQQTVDAFAGRLRDEVDPDEVSADLLAVLNRTVEPRGVALWVKDAP